MKSVRALAALHKVMQMPKEEDSEAEGLLEECQRHNRELRRIRKFVQSRKRKNDFEEKLASSISLFLEQGSGQWRSCGIPAGKRCGRNFPTASVTVTATA